MDNEEAKKGEKAEAEEEEITQLTPDEEVEQKLKEMENKYLRACADLENYRKRVAKEKEELTLITSERLLRELLEVKDHLELALSHSQETTEMKGLREGVTLTLKQLNKFLEKFGVKEIHALGENFDPAFHEAIHQEEGVEYKPGAVVRVFQKGYLFHGRLLRAARVAVAKVLVVFLSMLLVGCATGERGKTSHEKALPPTPEMERSFQSAEKLLFAKKFQEAELAYESYLREYPDNALTPKAYFRLGDVRFHEEDFSRSLSLYKKSLERGIHPEWGPLAIYKQAICYSRLEDNKKVLSTLDRIPWDQVDSKVGIRAGSLRITTAKKLEDPLQERKGYLELVDAYEGLRPTETKVGELNWIVSEKKAKEEIRQWISSEDAGEAVDIPPLRKWLKRFEGKTSGGYLTWKVARLYHQKGDYEDSAKWTQDYIQRYPKHEFVSEARTLLAEIDKRGVSPVAEGGRVFVGVLLPLSGKFSVYGESVLHGLECAAGIFAPCRGDLGVNLFIRDTQGDPQTAAQIVEELSRNPEVKAVIGPLPQVEIDQAVVVAEAAGLPMITLSQKPDVAKSGLFIFRNFLTVIDQVATLVDYACGEKRWKKYAILHPEGPGGEEYRKAFEDEVDRCGGKVVAKASYPPGTRNFTEAVRSLKFSSAEQSADESVSFQALFVPDVYRSIPGVVAALKFLGMEGVHLLGGAGWDHPDLVKGEGGGDLEGAIFVDGFFAKGSHFATRDFISTFQSAYGLEPTLLEAYAYDTLRLIGEVLRDHPTAERAEIQKILSRKRNFPGVTGHVSFDEEGDARRKLFVLTVEQGEIKEVR